MEEGANTSPNSFEQYRDGPASPADMVLPAPLQTKQPPPPSFPPSAAPASRERTTSPFSDESSELPPIQTLLPFRNPGEQHLPSISTVTDSASSRFSSPSAPQLPPNHWPSLNPLTAYYTPGHVESGDSSPLKMEVDSSTASTGTANAMSPGRASSVSLDDPDVRLAAEALGDLRADFVSPPPCRPTALPVVAPPRSEPLLSLLTTTHPLLARTIEGTTSAYNNSKNFSPRFKSGAEYVEGYLAPIGSRLGSVGRAAGVEDGVRWVLGAGRRNRPAVSAEPDATDCVSHKRRKVGLDSKNANDGMSPRLKSKIDSDAFGYGEERRLSMSTVESLPAYDDQRSPAYTESIESSRPTGAAGEGTTGTGQATAPAGAWQSRLMMTTSGLSVAMSEESLRSLKFCLNWLRWANDHTGKGISALKTALDQFDLANAQPGEAHGHASSSNEAGAETGAGAALEGTDRNELVARISALRGELLRTLRGVIDTVSKYAGGALPDNARVLVHRHLTSLPQRFRLASQTGSAQPTGGLHTSDAEVREAAQRVLVLAREGLDMMAQVSGVLDGTIVSAEEWCEKLGKKRSAERGPAAGEAGEPATIPTGADTDVVMHH